MRDIDTDALMRLLYLALLLAGVIFFAAGGRRLRLGHLRDLIIWVLMLAMVVIAYASWGTLQSALMPGRAVQIGDTLELRRGRDGHFHAELAVDGRPVRFLVDTGASDLVLSLRDATAIGVDVEALDFSGRAQTANGTVRTAAVRLGTVRLGDMVLRDVPARVNEGELDVSLLGMAYLGRFARIEIIGDRMVLHW